MHLIAPITDGELNGEWSHCELQVEGSFD